MYSEILTDVKQVAVQAPTDMSPVCQNALKFFSLLTVKLTVSLHQSELGRTSAVSWLENMGFGDATQALLKSGTVSFKKL